MSNAVSQLTVCDLVLRDLEPPRPLQYYMSVGPASKKRAGKEKWGPQGEGLLIQLCFINNLLCLS